MKRSQNQISQTEDDAAAVVKRPNSTGYVMLLDTYSCMPEGQYEGFFRCLRAKPLELSAANLLSANFLADVEILVPGSVAQSGTKIVVSNIRLLEPVLDELTAVELLDYPQPVRHVLLQKLSPERHLSFFEQMMAVNPQNLVFVKNPPPSLLTIVVLSSETGIALCRNQTEDLCQLAVAKFPNAIQYIRSPSAACVNLCVTHNSLALKSVPQPLRTREVCIRAVLKNEDALVAVPLAHKGAVYAALAEKYKA
jgi:hypothetical protein